jgi:DNA modification methylase
VRQRRSLTHVGGAVATVGPRELAAAVAHALDVPPPAERPETGDEPDRVHVHGFHTYPARMHPVTAERLVRALTAEGATVLDPFCGSGTVLVEALLASRRAIGTDLNPIAVRLARLKTTRTSDEERASIVATAGAVAAFADARRVRRAGATHRFPREDVELFDPHVLLELDSLRAGIDEEGAARPDVRGALELVLSAILLKVSRRASDTSATVEPRRIAAGYTARLFARKAEELSNRLAEFARRLPPGAPTTPTTRGASGAPTAMSASGAPGALGATIALDDATRLRTVAASTVDAVVTSPPYVGTYDYLAHHAARMRWLGLDARELARGEMGARRNYAALDARSAREAWGLELARALGAMRRVCRRGARVALVLADSAIGSEAIRADSVLASVAPDAGFTVLARASQARPHFHGPTAAAFRDSPRAEHAVILEKRS